MLPGPGHFDFYQYSIHFPTPATQNPAKPENAGIFSRLQLFGLSLRLFGHKFAVFLAFLAQESLDAGRGIWYDKDTSFAGLFFCAHFSMRRLP